MEISTLQLQGQRRREGSGRRPERTVRRNVGGIIQYLLRGRKRVGGSGGVGTFPDLAYVRGRL